MAGGNRLPLVFPAGGRLSAMTYNNAISSASQERHSFVTPFLAAGDGEP